MVVVGIVVLVIAVLALRSPSHHSTSAGSALHPTSTTASSPAAEPGTGTPSGSASASGTSSGPAVSTSPAGSTDATGSGSSAPGGSGTSPGSPGAAGSEPLIVLNDTYTANLARDAAQRFEAGGWTVTRYDEGFSNQIATTTAYYDPAVADARAAALALQQQFPTIARVAARFDGADPGQDPLPAGPVVVVLTTDYAPA